MRVLITGANGQLGQELIQSAPAGVEISAFDRDGLDISDKLAVHALLSELKPDVVINAAAYTAVDIAEQEQEIAFAVNADGPRNLAAACNELGARFIHVSTDFVFDGNHSTPYLPEDAANPLGVYGASKLEGERNVLAHYPDGSLVIRVGWLYSRFGNNFVKTILRLMAERDELGVVADQVGTPTNAAGLAQAIWQFADESFTTGIYHWSDAGVASWYDFAVAIMEEGVASGKLEKAISIKPIRTSDYPTPARRPQYSVLDKTAIWTHLDLKPLHWRVALRQMLQQL
jgi:dTDP-4-dehydrorhamnose reductase